MTTIDSYHLVNKACKEGNLTELKNLIEDGAKIFKPSSDDNEVEPEVWTPVLWAACNGHMEVLKYLMSNGAYDQYRLQINTEDNVNTPLHWACYMGHIDMVWYLLETGYSTKDGDTCENQPLHLAAAGGHRKVIEVNVRNLEKLV